MDFFNTMGDVDFVVGEEHTTAKNEANTNQSEKPYRAKITKRNNNL